MLYFTTKIETSIWLYLFSYSWSKWKQRQGVANTEQTNYHMINKEHTRELELEEEVVVVVEEKLKRKITNSWKE